MSFGCTFSFVFLLWLGLKMEKMKIKVKKKSGIWLVEVDGAIKAGDEFTLADELENCLRKSDVPKILVDLRKVTFINSAALGIFLSTFKEIENSNGRFGLCSANADVEHLLNLTRLNSILEVYKSQEEALESIID